MNDELIKRTLARLAELKGNLSEPAMAERKAHHKTIQTAAKPEHAFTIEGVTMDDTLVCACGWKSQTYWDGDDLAYSDWLKHLEGLLG